MSDLLTPAQIAEIAERADEQIREGGSEAGEEFAGYVISLLSHAAAQAARIEELEKALREIDSNRGGEANTAYALHRKLIQSANIARTALEKP